MRLLTANLSSADMKFLRTGLFWIHLCSGVVGGAIIAVMCFTGAALAFEKDLVAWAERDARRVTPPAADAVRLPLEELVRRVRADNPEARPAAITISNDPRDAVAFTLGRDSSLYVNPYTGEVRSPASSRMHDFLHVLEDWHRVLAMGGDRRAVGKAINGACNVAFFVLALTGLYLWWPRSLSWKSVKAVAMLNLRLAGKARDFNWHNSVGLWSAPVLIVLTLTALPISYRWAGNLVYRLAGEAPPAQGQGPSAAGPAPVEIVRPSPEARPLAHDALVAGIQQRFPRWETITLRVGPPQRPGAPSPRTGEGPAANSPSRNPNREAGERPRGEGRREGGGNGERRTPQAVTIVVKEPDAWPRTATTTVTLNPFTGETLRIEGFGDLSTGRRARTWMRFLHTGEALGAAGQLVAGLACLGGCVLVYTGFALAWRRFFGRKAAPAQAST